MARENVLKRIQDYWLKKQSGIQLADDRLRIKWSVIGEKDDFLNCLEDRRTRFGTGKPMEQTPSLFDGHE